MSTPPPVDSSDRPRTQRPRAARRHPRQHGAASGHPACGRLQRLAGYVDALGRPRELVARAGAHGSLLVVDRDAATLCDERLVAHLAADESRENAALVCRLYLRDRPGRRCRALVAEDLLAAPLEQDDGSSEGQTTAEALRSRPLVHDGRLYSLMRFPQRSSASLELRWGRLCAGGGEGWEPLSLRQGVEDWESYEPLRGLTARALADRAACHEVSVVTLTAELRRVQDSAIVLNRELRRAVLHAVRRGDSLSEIAIRCGMVKHDRRGHASGETSWLARRIGLVPQGGQTRPTRWVHSEVLALIARRGLGLSPREVEVQ